MRKIYKAVLLIVVSAVGCAVAFAQESTPFPDWVIERTEQTHALNGVLALTIENQFGDVRVRGTEDQSAAVFGISQRHSTDVQLPQVRFEIEGTGARLSVIYPEDESGGAGLLTQKQEKRRVDISVFVPKVLHLSIQTRDGLAESKGHSGSLDVKTEAGKIFVRSKGAVTARTTSGDAHVIFRNPQKSGVSAITTTSGDIRVLLMEGADVLVEVETAGAISTDYSIKIVSFEGTARKEGIAKIGAGSNSLRLSSKLGAVSLVRNISMSHSDEFEKQGP